MQRARRALQAPDRSRRARATLRPRRPLRRLRGGARPPALLSLRRYPLGRLARLQRGRPVLEQRL